MIVSKNPYTGEELDRYEEMAEAEINRLLHKSSSTFDDWRKTSFAERKKLMLRAAAELKENSREYALIITKEMGKPITQAIAEVEKSAWACEFYAETASVHLAPEEIKTDASNSYINYEPLGPILAIMPWNYPFWQVFRFAAPALMAGNVGVLKHASNVMGCSLAIQRVFERAGFPEGCFQSLIVGSGKIDQVIRDSRIKAVTLTGSTAAGKAVASTAGEEIKKSVLELGGSNALVVFEDANIAQTVDTCVQARFQNTGQSCIAGKRLLLHKSISEAFLKDLRAKVKDLKSGDPLDPDTYIGVQAREDLAKDLEKQIKDSVSMGAELFYGGKREGTYHEPTILINVSLDMPVFKEETFGPSIAVLNFETEQEAVKLVNATDFGLGVSIFTRDRERAKRLIPDFEDGAVFVNELVKSDPRLPFGGTKQSGYGRELSHHGIREFVNIKTVYFK